MVKTSSYLPPELIETILSSESLSVKALLRSKSVSKSWNSIIYDPLFIKLHHQKSKSRNSQDLFICNLRSSSSSGFNLVRLDDQKLEIVQELQSPYDCTHVLCRCGGVLLLTDDSRIQVLWNPSTRTQRKIWVPFQRAGSRYGLCPDPVTDDFKVVVVNEDDYSVYSVKNKSLIIKRKKFDGPYADYGRSIRDYTQVCVDGAVYWVWSRGNVDKIIYYDPRDDKFKVLQKPGCVKDDDGKRIFLVDLGGSLCLRYRGQDETTIRIWIKEKGIDNNSWKDLVSIENVKMGIWSFEPQCIVGNKIVIQDRFHTDLVVYSPLEKTFEQFGDTACRSGLVPYVASPVITKRRSKRKRLQSILSHVVGSDWCLCLHIFVLADLLTLIASKIDEDEAKKTDSPSRNILQKS